jgi:hypothetical protein
MMRQAARGALALVLVMTVLESAGLSQPTGLGIKVYYRDRKDSTGPEKIIDGDSLKVTPAGLQVINKDKVTATISPADVLRVDPGELAGTERKDLAAQITLERERKWEPARVNYLDMQKKAKDAKAPAKTLQYLEFKIAYTTARAADDADEVSWPEKAEAAQKLLGEYLITNPTGWEVWPIARAQAWLLLQLDRPANAAGTWAKLVKNPDVPADLQREAALEEIDCLVRVKQVPEATARIAEQLKSATAGPIKDRLTIYQTALKLMGGAPQEDLVRWVKPIQDVIDQTKDPGVRAVGYNMIGEVYMSANKPRDAMWEYLRVEVIYNQDRDEVAKAMLRLVKAFEAQQDDDRAHSYREKLRRYRATL